MTIDLSPEQLRALRALAHTEATNLRRASDRPLNRENLELEKRAADALELWAKLDEAVEALAKTPKAA